MRKCLPEAKYVTGGKIQSPRSVQNAFQSLAEVNMRPQQSVLDKSSDYLLEVFLVLNSLSVFC